MGDLVDDAGLKVDEEGTGDVVLVIGLVKEDVLAVVNEISRTILEDRVGCGTDRRIRGPVRLLLLLLQHAVRSDAMLQAELLPELGSYLVPALANLKRYYFSGHGCACQCLTGRGWTPPRWIAIALA